MYKLIHGDNLEMLQGIPASSVDLIYADPPFGTQKNWGDFDDRWLDHLETENNYIQTIALIVGEQSAVYLEWMRQRIISMHHVLRNNGSLYLHCDPTASHCIKSILDMVFGHTNFRNEIIWERSAGRSDNKGFARVHDVILLYAKGSDPIWNQVYQPLSDKYVKDMYRYKDIRGRYRTAPLYGAGISGGTYSFEWGGIKSDLWRFPKTSLDKLDKENLIHHGKVPSRKSYLANSKGIAARDVITDVGRASSKERVGYATQKPIALLERIVMASSNPGDLVLDPFCGSGTTGVAAMNHGRNFIGIDSNKKAIDIASNRIAASQRLI